MRYINQVDEGQMVTHRKVKSELTLPFTQVPTVAKSDREVVQTSCPGLCNYEITDINLFGAQLSDLLLLPIPAQFREVNFNCSHFKITTNHERYQINPTRQNPVYENLFSDPAAHVFQKLLNFAQSSCR